MNTSEFSLSNPRQLSRSHHTLYLYSDYRVRLFKCSTTDVDVLCCVSCFVVLINSELWSPAVGFLVFFYFVSEFYKICKTS